MRKEFVHYTSRKVKGASRSIQVAKKKTCFMLIQQTDRGTSCLYFL